MRLSKFLYWTPNYFRGSKSQRDFQRIHKKTDKVHREKQTKEKKPHPVKESSVVLDSSFFLSPEVGSSTPPRYYATQAALLLQRFNLTPMSELFSNKDTLDVTPDTLARLSLEARQTVLGPLSAALPPPSTRMPTSLTSEGSSSSPSTLKVIPDDYVHHPEQFLNPTAPSGGAPREEKKERSSACLSLEDSTNVLFLYDAVDSEDGSLLRQVLDDLNRFTRFNLKWEDIATATQVRLPLPQLLYALSNLGIIEEQLLHYFFGTKKRSPLLHDPEVDAKSNPLYFQLKLYTERELLLLMHSLSRFGFQGELAFKSVVRRFERRCLDRSSSVGRFMDGLRGVEKKRINGKALESAVAGDIKEGTLLQFLLSKPIPASVAVPLPLMLGVLNGIAMSPYRRPSLVKHISYFAMGSTVAEFSRILDTIQSDIHVRQHTQQVEQRLNILTRQLFQFIQVTETLECPQSLLVELFGDIRESEGKDVFVDGGEDGELVSDRTAYYDHVTADLIKLNHAH